MTVAKVFKIIGWVILGVAIAAALGLALGLAVMWLWNWLVCDLFGLPEITYWQAVGIFVLCHLLFKSHIGGHDHDNHRNKPNHGHVFARRVKAMLCKDGIIETHDPAPETESTR